MIRTRNIFTQESALLYLVDLHVELRSFSEGGGTPVKSLPKLGHHRMITLHKCTNLTHSNAFSRIFRA